MSNRISRFTSATVGLTLLCATGCGRTTSFTPTQSLPPDVVREMDAIRAVTKAAHDEYERLYTTVVFPNDTMKTAAAEWYRRKDFDWQVVQLADLRLRRIGLGQSSWDLIVAISMGDDYVEAEPSVFVSTSYYPRVVKKELASLAKLAALREEYEAARLRLAKALLAEEQRLSVQR